MRVLKVFVLGFSLFSPFKSWAQESLKPVQATTIQISNKSYRIQILLPDGNFVRMTLHEGEMGTITFLSENHTLGFTPISSISNPEQVEIRTFLITTRPDGNQTIKSHDSINLVVNGRSMVMDRERSFIFDLLNVNLNENKASSQTNSLGAVSPAIAPSRCCVTCGIVTACGCAVEMSCGSCCADQCC